MAHQTSQKGLNKMKRLTGWQRVLALVFAGIFALSAAMTGTAAWAELSQHRTNPFQGDGPPKPASALLQKYEMDTQIPVPGAHFALFRLNPDGTADLIDTFITGSDGQALASELEPGEYYWQETQAPAGFLPEIEDGQAKKYPFSVPGEEDGPVRTAAYNTRQLGSLTVTKTVAGEGADLNMAFTFTAVIGGRTEMFTLRHGHSILFEDIPVGTAYEVTEAPVEGYVTSSENNTGVVPAQGVTAAFTNTYQPGHGSLTVTKSVAGRGADLEKEFSFTAVIGGETHTFTLKHGQTKTFDGIPLGTNYTVTEADYSDEHYYTVGRVYSGAVQVGGTIIVLPVVNHYLPEPPPMGGLEISKTVIGEDAGPEKVFTFQITFAGEGAPASPQTFTLRHGEKKTFADIPHGVAYTVTETGAAGCFPDFTSTSGVAIGGQSVTVNFTNRVIPARQITVTKQVTGNPPAGDSEKLFHFTLTVNGTPHTFALKAGETSQHFAVRPGDLYSLAEQEPGGNYLRGGVVNGSGTVGDADVAIIQTNIYLIEELDIEAEKLWNLTGAPPGTMLPASIQLRLKTGDVIVRTVTVSPGSDGKWEHVFLALPKYDLLRNEIPYVVEEVRIPGWRPVKTGHTIENHYQPPVADDAVEVEKAITGTPPALGIFAFKFLLTPVNNAPMPSSNEITITGAGKASFGQITYDVPGTYIYTVTEQPGSLANWTYDASVYTLTVTVSEDEDGQLAAGRELTKAGQPAERALFTNHYSPVPEFIDVRVTKVWQGGGEHPQSVQAQLYRDGTAYGNPSTLSAANNWTRAWPALDKGHTWTVDEVNVPEGYTKTLSGDTVNGFIITNIKGDPPETVDVKVTKVWKGEDPDRPTGVAMQLYRDGAASGIPVTLSGGNGWTYTFAGLERRPASPGGEPYAWTVDEVNVPAGYSKAVTGDAANGFVVTNTKLPVPPPGDEITLSGKKTWNHEGNPMDKRPDSITVIIKADGAIVAQRLITAAEHWAWSFKLPKHNGGGGEIKYTVDEARFEDYVKTVDGYNLINTYKPGGNTDDPHSGKPTLPKTDDESNLALWLTLAFASLAALLAIIIPWKKVKGRRKQS